MITLKELARILNVSVSTVSKALNDSPEIGERTKRRIVELATELNYRPNRIAQQLKSNKTKTIGVIIPTVINPFFAEALHGIEKEASALDYDIIVCLSDESLEKEIRSIELLSNGSVDGFIIALARESQTKDHNNHLVSLSEQNLPVVLFDRSMPSYKGHYVLVDDFQSVYDVVKYLVETENRKHIALLSNIEHLSVGKRRIEGYSKVLEEHGLSTNILKLSGEKDVRKSIEEFIYSHPEIDAVVSIDHLTGVIALNHLKDMGKQIPEDISVVGFGSPSTQILTNPELAVIYQRAEAMGQQSMELLNNIITSDIKTREKHSLLRMKSELIKGGTLL
ncbi:MAG: LacI family DNA-binding transcriptional regulator [Bacteroidota bacterium]